jgi:hypothetical protein
MSRPPSLPAYPRRDGLTGLRVWCQFCDRWHLHGDPGDGGYGHRAAHCHDRDSPYRRTGYVLVPPPSRPG